METSSQPQLPQSIQIDVASDGDIQVTGLMPGQHCIQEPGGELHFYLNLKSEAASAAQKWAIYYPADAQSNTTMFTARRSTSPTSTPFPITVKASVIPPIQQEKPMPKTLEEKTFNKGIITGQQLVKSPDNPHKRRVLQTIPAAGVEQYRSKIQASPHLQPQQKVQNAQTSDEKIQASGQIPGVESARLKKVSQISTATATATSVTTSTFTTPSSIKTQASLPQKQKLQVSKGPDGKVKVKGLKPGHKLVRTPDKKWYVVMNAKPAASQPTTTMALSQVVPAPAAVTSAMSSITTPSTSSQSLTKTQALPKPQPQQKAQITKGLDKINQVEGLKSDHQPVPAGSIKLYNLTAQTTSASRSVATTNSSQVTQSQITIPTMTTALVTKPAITEPCLFGAKTSSHQQYDLTSQTTCASRPVAATISSQAVLSPITIPTTTTELVTTPAITEPSLVEAQDPLLQPQVIQLTERPDGQFEIEGLLPGQEIIQLADGELCVWDSQLISSSEPEATMTDSHDAPAQIPATPVVAPMNLPTTNAQSPFEVQMLPELQLQQGLYTSEGFDSSFQVEGLLPGQVLEQKPDGTFCVWTTTNSASSSVTAMTMAANPYQQEPTLIEYQGSSSTSTINNAPQQASSGTVSRSQGIPSNKKFSSFPHQAQSVAVSKPCETHVKPKLITAPQQVKSIAESRSQGTPSTVKFSTIPLPTSSVAMSRSQGTPFSPKVITAPQQVKSFAVVRSQETPSTVKFRTIPLQSSSVAMSGSQGIPFSPKMITARQQIKSVAVSRSQETPSTVKFNTIPLQTSSVAMSGSQEIPFSPKMITTPQQVKSVAMSRSQGTPSTVKFSTIPPQTSSVAMSVSQGFPFSPKVITVPLQTKSISVSRSQGTPSAQHFSSISQQASSIVKSRSEGTPYSPKVITVPLHAKSVVVNRLQGTSFTPKSSSTPQKATSAIASKSQVTTLKKTTTAASSSFQEPKMIEPPNVSLKRKISCVQKLSDPAVKISSRVSTAEKQIVLATNPSQQQQRAIVSEETPSTSNFTSTVWLGDSITVPSDLFSTSDIQMVPVTNSSQQLTTTDDQHCVMDVSESLDQQLASDNYTFTALIDGNEVLVHSLPVTGIIAKKRKPKSHQNEDHPETKPKSPKRLSKMQKRSEIFISAIENNDFAAVHDFLKAGFNPNNNLSAHCLSIAVAKNNLDIVKLLVEYNVNVNRRVKPHESPICVAVINGYYEIVNFLISHGANVHKQGSEGFCPLHLIFKSALKTFDEIRNVNRPNFVSSDLENEFFSKMNSKVVEAEFQYFMTLKCLLEKDSSRLNERCCKNSTVLGSLLMDPYTHYENSRLVAMFVKLLIKFGADVNITSKGKPPLLLAFCKEMWMRYERYVSAVPDLLLIHGAKIDAVYDSNLQRNILHFLIRNRMVDEFKLVVSYLNLDVNSEKYYYHAMPLLHYAGHLNRGSIVRFLLLAGADVFQKDKNNCSIFQLDWFAGGLCEDAVRLVVFFIALAVKQNKHELTDEEDDILNDFYFEPQYYWSKFYHNMDWNAPITTKTLPISLLDLFSASEIELMNIAKKYVPENFQNKVGFGKCLKFCYNIIEACLEKGRDRLELLNAENVQKLSHFISPSVQLDQLVFDKIINLLSNADIRNLTRSSEIGVFQIL